MHVYVTVVCWWAEVILCAMKGPWSAPLQREPWGHPRLAPIHPPTHPPAQRHHPRTNTCPPMDGPTSVALMMWVMPRWRSTWCESAATAFPRNREPPPASGEDQG